MRPPPSIYDNNKGFTLVELAISLMVIGLLIAGVLKGKELIKNARNMKYVREINEYDTAVSAFIAAYDNLPGDMPNPGRVIPNCDALPCNESGNANGLVGGGLPMPRIMIIGNPLTPESRRFWLHLAKAGFISRKINTEYTGGWSGMVGVEYPAIVDKNVLVYPQGYAANVDWGSPMEKAANYYVLRVPTNGHSITAALAYYIDEKLDDGKPGTGLVRAGGRRPESSNPESGCVTVNEYLVATSDICLTLIIRMGIRGIQ